MRPAGGRKARADHTEITLFFRDFSTNFKFYFTLIDKTTTPVNKTDTAVDLK